jgi:hypothetical protein
MLMFDVSFFVNSQPASERACFCFRVYIYILLADPTWLPGGTYLLMMSDENNQLMNMMTTNKQEIYENSEKKNLFLFHLTT